MKVDAGSVVSVVSKTTLKKLFPGALLKNSSAKLRTYSGQLLEVLGKIEVLIIYGKQYKHLPLYVVSNDGPSLHGRECLQHIKVNCRNCCN